MIAEEDDWDGHQQTADCWCSPRVEHYPEGNIIVHSRTDN